MNKKGFTLIEIMIIIGIVAVVSTTGTILFTQTLKQLNEKKLEDTIEEIELATDVYFNKYPYLMEELYQGYTGEKICTRIYKLQNEGLIDKDIKNPLTNERISGTLCVYSTLDENGNIKHGFSL